MNKEEMIKEILIMFEKCLKESDEETIKATYKNLQESLDKINKLKQLIDKFGDSNENY